MIVDGGVAVHAQARSGRASPTRWVWLRLRRTWPRASTRTTSRSWTTTRVHPPLAAYSRLLVTPGHPLQDSGLGKTCRSVRPRMTLARPVLFATDAGVHVPRALACRYVIEGDGCNMEGISNEAASLAGHWGLGKLIVFYDDNRISIDGNTDISFTEDVSARYEALGWHVQHVVVRRSSVALHQRTGVARQHDHCLQHVTGISRHILVVACRLQALRKSTVKIMTPSALPAAFAMWAHRGLQSPRDERRTATTT